MDKWATGEDGDGGEYVPSDDDKPRPRSRLRKGGQSNAKRAAGSRNRAVKQSAAKPEAPEASALAQPPEPKLPIASADTSAAPPSLNAYLAKQRMIPKRDKQAKRRQLQQQQQTSSSGPSATTQNAVATAKAVAMSMGIGVPRHRQPGGASLRQQKRPTKRRTTGLLLSPNVVDIG